MNLKRTFVTAVAAVGLMASIAAPITTAQITDDTTAVVIVGNAGGVFEPKFCSAVDLGSAEVTAASGAIATGGLAICYTDTKAQRDEFRAYVQASDFTSTVTMPYTSLPYTIPAANFTLVTVYNPLQDQWSRTNPAQTACPFVPGNAGDAGVYPIGNIGGKNGAGASVTSGSAPWIGGNLATSQYVNYGWEGVGTANQFNCTLDSVQGTTSLFTSKLVVPAGAAADSYSSDLTLTVTYTAP